ncbi:MAG: hypothetical protein SV760_05420 [Halobacteria archaeon]|nr:hypothetical protein [Halobacteria archaeon]
MTEGKTKPEEKSKDNRVVQHLRSEGPAIADELPRTPNLSDKNWIGILDVTKSGTGASKSRGRTRAVYYLYGDERRAVRKYVEENEEFVESCMDDKVNPINMGMEDYWWQMFREEWIWGGYED